MTPSMSFARSAFATSSMRCRMRASSMASSFSPRGVALLYCRRNYGALHGLGPCRSRELQEVRHAELRVSVRAWRTKAVPYVLEQLAAGVEDSPLAIGPVEPTPVVSQRRLKDLGAEIPVDQREVANRVGDGRVGPVDYARDDIRPRVHQHVLRPEVVVAERLGAGFRGRGAAE